MLHVWNVYAQKTFWHFALQISHWISKAKLLYADGSFSFTELIRHMVTAEIKAALRFEAENLTFVTWLRFENVCKPHIF